MKLRRASERLTPHFSKAEMRCKCRREGCNAAPMQRRFLDKLEALRVAWGQPLVPSSAARCATWNAKVGGSPKSQHLIGNACDFWFQDIDDARHFAALAEKHGFGGIGIGTHLVHVDDRDGHARWEYRD